MTKQEIIDKWKKEIEYLKDKQCYWHINSRSYGLYTKHIRSISAMLADIKKLNEATTTKRN